MTYLNHGAFGSTLKEAMEVVHKWQVHCDKQPLRFFDREMMPILVYVVRRMASFIGECVVVVKQFIQLTHCSRIYLPVGMLVHSILQVLPHPMLCFFLM